LNDISIYLNATVLIYKTLQSTETCRCYIRVAHLKKKTQMNFSEQSNFDGYKIYPLNKI